MCRKFSTFSCEGWSQKIHQAHEYAYTHSEKVTGNRFNMQKGNTHTHTYNHTCGPGLYPPHLFVWWLLKPPWWELIWSARRRKTERENKQRRINGNSLLLTCSLSPIVALRGAQSAQTHSITHACTNTHPFTHTHTCQRRPLRMVSESAAAKMAAFCLQISLSSSVHGEHDE